MLLLQVLKVLLLCNTARLPLRQGSKLSLASARHVAFVCDGNSRWAKQHNQPIAKGHEEGARRVLDLLPVLKEQGVQYCTLFGFSNENWSRSPSEIQELFRVMEATAECLVRRRDSSAIRLRVIGNLKDPRIPSSLLNVLDHLMTECNQKLEELWSSNRETDSRYENPLTLCLALNYGGRQDIVQAAQQVAHEVQAGHLDPNSITSETLSALLWTRDVPDPDLIVRTSGECRLSNFLLWNGAYSEIYFTDVLWPDFDQDCLLKALDWYSKRNRRFGGRPVAI